MTLQMWLGTLFGFAICAAVELGGKGDTLFALISLICAMGLLVLAWHAKGGDA